MMWINTGDVTSRISSDNVSPNVNTVVANTTNIAGVVFKHEILATTNTLTSYWLYYSGTPPGSL